MAQKVAPRTWFTPRQEQFLAVVAKEKYVSSHFYLTGGTALAAIYYNHRESLDIDLFSVRRINRPKLIEFFFNRQRQIGWTKLHPQPGKGEGNFILGFPDQTQLNIDFVHYIPPRLRRGLSWHGLPIDSLEDIATNKLNTILQRSYLRDYIDLYFLMQREKFTLKKLRQNLIKKFDWPIDAFTLSRRFLKVNELADLPRMKASFSRPKMIRFFERLADLLRPEIFT